MRRYSLQFPIDLLLKFFRKPPMPKLPDYYPMVKLILKPEESHAGPFKSPPAGVTVHYTASRSVEGTHQSLLEQGLNYHFMIDRDGKVVQTAKLSNRVHHAGAAVWRGVSPNRLHISIALLSWGRLRDGKTWTGKKLPDEDIRTVNNIGWDKATPAQEEKLIELCRWLVAYGIPAVSICGHDECAIPAGRKIDPGNILSFSMDKLREICEK